MAKIYIRGLGVREVPFEVAKQIDDDLNEKKISGNDLVRLEGLTCRASQIQSIVLEKDTKYSTEPEEVDKSYSIERKRVLAQTPAQRAERVEFFKLIWYCFHKENPGQSEVDEAKIRQEKFFRENPGRLHADPRIFRDMMGDRKPLKFGFPIIERIVDTDLAYMRNDKKYIESLSQSIDYPREGELTDISGEIPF